LYELLGNPTT